MVEVCSAGIYSSIQDRGRHGHRNQGVPVSGAMDQQSLLLATRLLGNNADSAVIETFLHGLTLKFHIATTIALTGAEVHLLCNGVKVPSYSRILVDAGDEISISKSISGTYSYVAVQGGFITENVLGSQSFYKGITASGKLSSGDQIPLLKVPPVARNYSPLSMHSFSSSVELSVMKGPEWESLSPEHKKTIAEGTFEVDLQSNRMSINLNHDYQLSAPEIVSSPVAPGTVQMMPSGKLAILMRDAQTTGGYARILQVQEPSLFLLAQSRPGTNIHFAV